MKVKVSDFISNYLISKGMDYNFTVPGGGAMHLNMSFGNQKEMHNIFMQHEQAAAIAAEAFFRASNKLPIVCCTTGPGGTNTLTGVLGAWLDSIPMFIISGQVKYSATVGSTGFPMRIYGDQEFDIVKTAATMTKYAVMVTNPVTIKYHIDKSLYLAKNGRPGPVWLDIPQNVQNAVVEESDLLEFDETEMSNTNPLQPSKKTIEIIIEKLREAKRPVLYSGIEIRTHGVYNDFVELAKKLNIPVVTSFDGVDILDDNDPLYAGRAGDVGNRYGNWVVQNSDFLLTIGTRLGIRQVNYAVETWARDAFVVMVHEDPLEITKPVVHVELPVRSTLKEFIKSMTNALNEPLPRKKEWFEKCYEWKKNYPVVTQKHYENSTQINAYAFIKELSKRLNENELIVSANGTACVVGCNALEIKKGQRFILNSGAASMGYDLPAAIGACFSKNKCKTICLAGDGSIQMNLQELQTIVYHNLPVKIVVINNSGYHSMRLTQKNLFSDLKKVGIGPETNDLGFPDMEKISNAYGIPYCSIESLDEIDKLDKFLNSDGYYMCEVFVDINQVFEPKPSAKKLDDGTLVSPPLEDMAPFLSREELKNIMIIPLVGE